VSTWTATGCLQFFGAGKTFPHGLTGTDAAGDWFRDNVDAASWQRLGAVLWIDHHYAGQIIKDLADASLTMEYD
jgi:hypothetical protein